MNARRALTSFLGPAIDQAGGQAALARQLGLSRSMVNLWSKGKRDIPERYRDELRKASQGKEPTAIGPSIAKVRKPKQATKTPVAEGKKNVSTNYRSAFSAEIRDAIDEGRPPTSFRVTIHGFNRSDSSKRPPRDKRFHITDLAPEDIRDLGKGTKKGMENVLNRYLSNASDDDSWDWTGNSGFSFDT